MSRKYVIAPDGFGSGWFTRGSFASENAAREEAERLTSETGKPYSVLLLIDTCRALARPTKWDAPPPDTQTKD